LPESSSYGDDLGILFGFCSYIELDVKNYWVFHSNQYINKAINGSEFTPWIGHLGYSETGEGLKLPLEIKLASLVAWGFPWIVEVACMERSSIL
jgi:hypothetical protein